MVFISRGEQSTSPMARWAKLRTFAKSFAVICNTLGQSASLKSPEPLRRGGSVQQHSGYIDKLRTGVKGMGALVAFDIKASTRTARVEAEQLLDAGGVVTSVDDAADLEKTEYWQQGDASLATKEKMEARQALRYNKLVLAALQLYWEAAQRSLHSGGDPSANELHQEGHALMLRRIYRVMIKDFDPADCERCIAEDWARDAKGKDLLTRKAFCDAFFELADTWTAGIDAREYAAFLRTLFDSVTIQRPVIGPDGQVMMVAFVWKDEVECVFDEAYAEEEEEQVEERKPVKIDEGQGAVIQESGEVVEAYRAPSSTKQAPVAKKPPRVAKDESAPVPKVEQTTGEAEPAEAPVAKKRSTRKAKESAPDEPDDNVQPTEKPVKDYRAKAKKKGSKKKKGEEETSIQSKAVVVVQSMQRKKKAVKKKKEREKAVATITKHAAAKADNVKKKRATQPEGPVLSESRSREKNGDGSGVAGSRGQLQYWALRKGLPPRLQEVFDELPTQDQVAVAKLSQEKRLKFLRIQAINVESFNFTTEQRAQHVEARRGLDPRLRAVFDDLMRADQLVVAFMTLERRVLFLQRRADLIDRGFGWGPRTQRPLRERMLQRAVLWAQAEGGAVQHAISAALYLAFSRGLGAGKDAASKEGTIESPSICVQMAGTGALEHAKLSPRGFASYAVGVGFSRAIKRGSVKGGASKTSGTGAGVDAAIASWMGVPVALEDAKFSPLAFASALRPNRAAAALGPLAVAAAAQQKAASSARAPAPPDEFPCTSVTKEMLDGASMRRLLFQTPSRPQLPRQERPRSSRLARGYDDPLPSPLHAFTAFSSLNFSSGARRHSGIGPEGVVMMTCSQAGTLLELDRRARYSIVHSKLSFPPPTIVDIDIDSPRPSDEIDEARRLSTPSPRVITTEPPTDEDVDELVNLQHEAPMGHALASEDGLPSFIQPLGLSPGTSVRRPSALLPAILPRSARPTTVHQRTNSGCAFPSGAYRSQALTDQTAHIQPIYNVHSGAYRRTCAYSTNTSLSVSPRSALFQAQGGSAAVGRGGRAMRSGGHTAKSRREARVVASDASALSISPGRPASAIRYADGSRRELLGERRGAEGHKGDVILSRPTSPQAQPMDPALMFYWNRPGSPVGGLLPERRARPPRAPSDEPTADAGALLLHVAHRARGVKMSVPPAPPETLFRVGLEMQSPLHTITTILDEWRFARDELHSPHYPQPMSFTEPAPAAPLTSVVTLFETSEKWQREAILKTTAADIAAAAIEEASCVQMEFEPLWQRHLRKNVLRQGLPDHDLDARHQLLLGKLAAWKPE